jgi:glutamate/tyrosine decarboxylase-like PLP-dependent enzyme
MRDDSLEILGAVAKAAEAYLRALPDEPVLRQGADGAARSFEGGLPESGHGASAAIERLLEDGVAAATRSSGPRFFHFVTGGTTPAALGADWLASLLDQNSFTWVASPLGARLERVAVDWLKDLFGLPADWGGVLTTGATSANFTALAAARGWWGERHGVDVDEVGTAVVPSLPIFSSGYLHASARKALAMLGFGRSTTRVLARDDAGRLDLDALERGLSALDGAPALLIGNAGDVNTGDFDPIGAMADLAERHGAWLHVDGAFGLFARVSPRVAPLAAGVERAHSVIGDGHKWLNVPYDCGFAFVREPARLGSAFSLAAAYLPEAGQEPAPSYGYLGPEASRRSRSLAVWSTLYAYGREGYRELVERHVDLAQHLARRVDEAPELERLAPVPLNIVCFRVRPPRMAEEELDELNTRLGEAVLADGRVYVGTTVYAGKVAFRPAIVNWRTGEEDVDLLVDVVLELARDVAGVRPLS